MYQEFYRHSEYLHLPLFVLVFFVAVFVAVLVWIFGVRRNDGMWKRMAEMPLAAEHPRGKNDE